MTKTASLCHGSTHLAANECNGGHTSDTTSRNWGYGTPPFPCCEISRHPHGCLEQCGVTEHRSPVSRSVKDGLCPLNRIRHGDPSAEAVGARRAHPRCTAIRQRLGLTSQRTTSEAAGVAGALRGLTIRIGDRHSAAGQPVRTGEADSCGAAIGERLGLSLQRSQIEFTGVTCRLR